MAEKLLITLDMVFFHLPSHYSRLIEQIGDIEEQKTAVFSYDFLPRNLVMLLDEVTMMKINYLTTRRNNKTMKFNTFKTQEQRMLCLSDILNNVGHHRALNRILKIGVKMGS